LRYLDLWNDQRRTKALRYKKELEGSGVVCPVEKEGSHHVYHLFAIRSKRRNGLQAYLKRKGIDTLIHYPIPIHLQKAYKDLGYKRGDFPVTERFSKQVLSLPFFPELTESEMDEVATQIKMFAEVDVIYEP
jgi:dTDP-4-amino-4,6-dideoxygalactose transaminase